MPSVVWPSEKSMGATVLRLPSVNSETVTPAFFSLPEPALLMKRTSRLLSCCSTKLTLALKKPVSTVLLLSKSRV